MEAVVRVIEAVRLRLVLHAALREMEELVLRVVSVIGTHQ